MAYCLRSFVETLDQVLNPQQHHKNWVLEDDKIPQFKSLLKNASFLCDFLDESSPLIQKQIASLEDEVMAAAEKAADTLEFHITNQILSSPEGQSFTISPPDLADVIHVFEVAKQKLIMINGTGQPSNLTPHVSSTHHPESKTVVVGLQDDLKQLRIRLTSGWTKELDIIPIVGMGGMGKTTLARLLYDNFSSTRSQFDCCAWVTVSQSYDPKQILQTLLDETIKSLNKKHEKPESETANSLNKMHEQPESETANSLNKTPEQKRKTEQEDEYEDLVVALHKNLCSRRYLIVIDDIWSSNAWDGMRRAFPKDDSQGSRIILTTRENTIVDYVNSKSHEMHLINKDDSWELLKGKVFSDQSCPRKLEEVGKTIASSCGGLPLALHVIGGLLSESPRTKEYWTYVAQDVGSFIAKKDDKFYGIFSWSFAHLPHHLKPCFLYMGAFPENHAIKASKIIKLWVSEGFLKPIKDKSLEEAAEIHLKALVDRNLIFVRAMKKKSMKAKSYGIHHLLRDLCLQKAQEKMFLNHVKDLQTNNPLEDMLWSRRVSVHSPPNHLPSLKLTPHARSFLCIPTDSVYHSSVEIISCLCFKFSLLRVLDMFRAYSFPELILNLVNLRYLAGVGAPIPKRITMLRNLQTLIASEIDSIAVIADMPQLRHLIVNQGIDCYRSSGDCSRFNLHKNLQTLSKVSFRALSQICGKLPNLRKLKIESSLRDDGYFDIPEALKFFDILETIKCDLGLQSSFSQIPNPNFPDSLKHLTLSKFPLPRSHLDAIGMLPNLQILILESCEFKNPDWETCEGGFSELQYLHIKNAGELTNIVATESVFPVLRHLVVESCVCLNEIPLEFGEIDTLDTVEVVKCSYSVVNSARIILEEQREYGNTILQLYLDGELEMDENQELSLKFYTFSRETILPHLLRNLTVECCRVPKTLLPVNDCLPEFQVLQVEYCHFESSTWVPFKGVFFKLQCLKIVESDLRNWLATEFHFPVLQHLVVRDCCHLKEIPEDFGRITTLKIIEVDRCKLSVFESARIILKEQCRFGNSRLQLHLGQAIEFWSSKEEGVGKGESLIVKVEENHGLSVYGYDLNSKITFPSSLIKLTLRFCEVPQTILNAIGALPQIQVLKLTNCRFESEDWEPCEHGFRELLCLHIHRVRNLANWLATERNFPVLQHLVLQDCSHLNKIPNEIGGKTLKIIEVARCKPSVFHSARRILEDRHNALQLLLGGEFEMDESYRLSLKFCTLNSETIFPHFLRNLTLECCRVSKTLLSANNDLPAFEVLNIEYCRFESSTWETFGGVFSKIQYLKIVELDLKSWLATENHFPALRYLVIRNCGHLDEIPSDFGGIKTLEIIEVDGCKHSVFKSANKILEEQRLFGNDRLQLRLGHATDVWSSKEDEDEVIGEDERLRRVDNHGLSLNHYNFSSKTTFPPSLKKLTLRCCEIPQTILDAIGVLPEIQVLKLSNCSFESSIWEPSEDGFCQLKYLEIAGSNLENLLADALHFPVLQHLIFYDCPFLIEIPYDIGYITTLEIIEVDECKPSLCNSAEIILKHQHHRFGNDLLQLRLGGEIYEPEQGEAEEDTEGVIS